MLRRLLNLAPLVVLPTTYTLIRMNTHQPQVPSAVPLPPTESTQQEFFPVTNLDNKPSEAHQQQTRQEQLPNSPIEQPQQAISQQQKQAGQLKQQEQAKTDPVQSPVLQSAFEVLGLQQNEAIVHSNCPPHMITYLKKAGYKIYHRHDSRQSITLKNRRGDQRQLDLAHIAAERKDGMQIIANFINPPLQVSTAQQAQQIMNIQQPDSFIIASYLPNSQNYDQLIKSRTSSEFDSFTASRKANLPEQEQRFTQLAYNSSSQKNSFVVIRSKEVADYMRISPFSIGVPYIINKTTKYSGNESNNQWQGTRYNVINLTKLWKSTPNKETINHLTHFYINKVENEADAFNKVRQMQMSADQRKVLLVYTNEDRVEFHNKLDSVLEKVGRTEKEKVIVIKTQNQQVLKKIFKVEPDHFTTVRVLNLNQMQKPLFGSQESAENYFSRSKVKGPFRYENICNFLNSESWQQHYESKRKLTYVKTVAPTQLKKLDNTLVLLQKEGCQGCRYLEETMDQLKKLTKALSTDHKFKKNLIYKYQIEDPSSLTSLKIRRYSIFNESLTFTPPTTTPKLFLFSEGKYLDLRVDQSLNKIQQVKSESQVKSVDEAVLADIINKIRMSQNQPFSQF